MKSRSISFDDEIVKNKSTKLNFIYERISRLETLVNNMQNSLTINKSIISELLTSSPNAIDKDGIMNKLNNENTYLLEEVKKLQEKLNGTQTELLIANQIISNYKKSEKEFCKEILLLKKNYFTNLKNEKLKFQIVKKKYEESINTLGKFEPRIANYLKTDADNETFYEQNINQENGSLMTMPNFEVRLPSRINRNMTLDFSTSTILKAFDLDKESIEKEVIFLRMKIKNLLDVNNKLSNELKQTNLKLIACVRETKLKYKILKNSSYTKKESNIEWENNIDNSKNYES